MIITPSGEEKEVHAVRLRFYEGTSFQLTEEIIEQYLYHVADSQYIIEAIIGCSQRGQDFYLKVHWKGFEASEATWQPRSASSGYGISGT